MKLTRAKSVLIFSFVLIFLACASSFAQAQKTAASSGDKADNAIKMLEKIEKQVNNRSLDLETRKQFIEMLELEIERENFFIDELKERVKFFDQYFSMLEVVKNKTEELKTKLEGGAPKAAASGRISQGAAKQVTADQIYDVATYVTFSESKKMLEDIEKDVDANKISAADQKTLIKKLNEQLDQIDSMVEETRNNKRNIEKSIIKMLEVRLRSKNLLDKFYKNIK